MKHFMIWSLLWFLQFALFSGEVYLFQTTDLHGIVHNTTDNAGAPSVAAALYEDAEKTGRDKSIVIDCGDLLQGSLESSLDQGKTMLRLLNAAKYDVWVPGNHDFEFGANAFSERIREFRGEVLAANLKYPGVKNWKIFERNGYRIAVIGMTNPHLGKWLFHPEKEGFFVTGVESALRKILPRILQKKNHAVILAIHSGLYPSKRLNDPGLFALARKFPEITVILGGHTHEKIICKQLSDSGACYFQAGAHGGGYLKIKLDFPDQARKEMTVSGKYITAAPAEKLPEPFRWNRPVPSDKFRSPVKPSPREIAQIFARSIHQAYPETNIVFHGALTKFQPCTSTVSLINLFRICPYENKVLLAYLNKKEFDSIVREQEENRKYGMIQNPFFFPSGKNPFGDDPERRVLTAFNSYSAASAGGRFPVLNNILNRPEARAVLTDTRIFDLLQTYTKEK